MSFQRVTFSIMGVYPLRHLPYEFLNRQPQLTRSKESLYALSQLILTHPLLRSSSANKNSVVLVIFQRMVDVAVYVFSHLENRISWVNRMLKIILKYNFISPYPHVPTSHRKNCSPLFIMNTMQLMVNILKDPVSMVKRKKIIRDFI